MPEQVGRLLMLLASFGEIVSEALDEAAPDREFVSNVSILTLFRLHLDGPARPAELAALTRMTTGGASKMIDRLELAGMVERAHHSVADDQRAVLVSLTDAGHRAVEEFTAIFNAHVEASGDLIDQLAELLARTRRPSG